MAVGTVDKSMDISPEQSGLPKGIIEYMYCKADGVFFFFTVIGTAFATVAEAMWPAVVLVPFRWFRPFR
jgi:hypothetical protein